MPLTNNDPFVAAIRDRLCTILEGQAHLSLGRLATVFDVEADRLRVFVEDESRALALGEDRSDDGRRALSAFVREQYQRLRDGLAFFSWSLLRGR